MFFRVSPSQPLKSTQKYESSETKTGFGSLVPLVPFTHFTRFQVWSNPVARARRAAVLKLRVEQMQRMRSFSGKNSFEGLPCCGIRLGLQGGVKMEPPGYGQILVLVSI